MYVCDCTRPTEQRSVASCNAAWSEESFQPIILPNDEQLLEVVQRMVVLRPAVYGDKAATLGRCCDSALLSASLDCMQC